MIKYIQILSLLLILVIVKNEAYAQDLIERTKRGISKTNQTKPNLLAQQVAQNKQSNARFNEFSLFELDNSNGITETAANFVTASVNLTIKSEQLEAFLATQPVSAVLEIPVDEKSSFKLELFKVDLFSEDFIYRNQDGTSLNHLNHGVFYRGIVQGDNNSIASASIFGNEIRIMIGDDEGNYVIGKMKNAPAHVLYNDRNLLLDKPEGCVNSGEQNLGKSGLIEQVESASRNRMNKCIPIYVECDHDMYIKQGSSETNVIAFVSALVNETATIYANEQINIALSDVKVWTSTDPYASLSSTSDILQRFGELTKNNYNGRLAHFISTRSLGGGIAWVDVLCSSYFTFSGNHAGPYAVSASMGTSITAFPTYSWNVEVFTHEMGHNLGSPHTQNCSWNGNNTAIDNCSPTEGGCSSTTNGCPPNGGTIMSYCHLLQNCSIDFNNGFGSQPGNLIRNRYNSASCSLTVPTCDDDVQNGDEEGIDCGGSNCAPCPCYETPVSLSLTFDNYPAETSWTIKNAAGQTLHSGSGYSQANATIQELFNLPVATGYVFQMNDGYGDGICCSYGTGSFTLTDNKGTTIATGSDFGSSFSVTFCTETGSVTDNCPDDPDKTEPGVCGCGVADTDANNNGIYDCLEEDDCQENVMVNSISGNTTEVTAQKQIITEGSVLIENNVMFKAGESIILNAGFEAVQGSEFIAKIEACTPNNLATENGISQKLQLDPPSSGVTELNIMPNPFQWTTTIQYILTQTENVSIRVLDVNGQVLKDLEKNTLKTEGLHELQLNAANWKAGVYYLVLSTKMEVISRKIVMIR